MCVRACVYRRVCIGVCVRACVSVCVCVCLSLSLSLYIYISTCIFHKQEGQTAVHVAAASGKVDVLKKFLLAGIEVDDRDTVTYYSNTPDTTVYIAGPWDVCNGEMWQSMIS